MRLAVISDIHGNYRALQAVLGRIDRLGVSEIVSLGDNVGYGPEPEEVTRELMRRGIHSVMGNHEFALVNTRYFQRLNEGPRQSLALTRELLTPESLDWLASLPPVLLRHGARLVHGCPPESVTAYLFDPTDTRLFRLFAGYGEPVCFIGHTHGLELYSLRDEKLYRAELAPGHRTLDTDGRHIIVSGSVGQPRDLISSEAKFLLWNPEEGSLEVCAVPYDVQSTVRLIHERGFPGSNASRLVW